MTKVSFFGLKCLFALKGTVAFTSRNFFIVLAINCGSKKNSRKAHKNMDPEMQCWMKCCWLLLFCKAVFLKKYISGKTYLRVQIFIV